MTDSTRRRTARSAADLVAAGVLAPADRAAVERVAARYAVAITPEVLELIGPAAQDDPVARQFVPAAAELETAPGELADPIGDAAHSPVRGIVHRYPDRVLLMPLLACPVYCRFCFRRAAVGGTDGHLDDAGLAAALAYIRERPEIWEVILTGGDPLMLPPARLAAIVAALDAIPHVAVIRVHSRVPVTDPRRVTPALVEALDAAKAVYVALHCNHARELTEAARAACRRITAAGIPMLAQTVLLKGVNDDADTLEALMRALVASRVKPYYLHHPDLAPGTGHFRTELAAGRELARSLRARASGLCQPAYVLDIPGGHGKVPVGPCHWDEAAGTVEDAHGRRHPYPPR